MREFEFPVEFAQSGRRGLLISVHTGPSHTAQEFIKKEFITKPIITFLDVLSQWKGLENNFRVSALGQRTLSFEISAELVSEPWQVASIVGVIDSATFLQDIDDNPFITSVAVEAGHLPGLTLESAYEDMNRFAAQCATELSGYLGDGFQDEGEVQTEWPADAEQYFFDIAILVSKPIERNYADQAHKLFDGIEISLAGTAFESEHSPEYLFDEGLIPFPAKTEITNTAIQYSIETPPSDLSIPLILIRDTLTTRYHAKISEWKVQIRERW